MQDSVVIEPNMPADSAVIWLHGLGADGHDFESVIPELNLPENHRVRFIFPHAPIQPVTVNMGYEMRAWYDIKRIDDIDREVDLKGIEDSIARIQALVESVIQSGISHERILIAGFSQGGAVALLSALTLAYQFAGVMLLSTYLPDWAYFKEKLTSANRATEFLIAHGENDPIVPIQAAKIMLRTLEELGLNVTAHYYPIEHSLCLEEIKVLSQFIQTQLKIQ
ncbi:alpha/beta hydrolase [Fangia hongkongensis]|uniref:alpha/beta hydrolase n=1 Tax=Fangia hongkongensis TaxID=270495 RepID=UPI000377FC5D|nr:dienelactone hydrolase family protein [Fangia hongkongensis]MBK2126276.1 dienelactone hydrolase family protein [Fangia hongkongensis]